MYRPHNFSNKTVVYLSIGAIILGLIVAYIQSRPDNSNETDTLRSVTTGNVPQPPNSKPTPDKKDEFCIQVITPARNPQTGDTEDFPSPCDVPDGWEIIR